MFLIKWCCYTRQSFDRFSPRSEARADVPCAKAVHADIAVKVLIREVELTLRVFFSVPISKVQLRTMRLEGDQIVIKLGF